MPALKYDNAGRYFVKIFFKGNCVIEGEMEFIPSMYKPKTLTVENFIRQQVIRMDWALKIERVEVTILAEDQHRLPLGFLPL
ncbi:MAG: hypothetical protein PHP03_03585 [Candidatus Pacebacteria bacterium]|nr:hypothetical protein [Candidatus Paceibacterota bacterium]